MSVRDWLPRPIADWMTPEAQAEAAVDAEAVGRRLEEIQKELAAVDEQYQSLAAASLFVEAKTAEFEKVKHALVFAATPEQTLLLQGEARALWNIASAPDALRERRRTLEAELVSLQGTADAGLAGER